MESIMWLRGHYMLTCILALVIIFFTRLCRCTIENIDLNYTHPLASFDELYADGIDAYSDGKWNAAIRSFELAISDYRHEQEVKIYCRMKCKSEMKNDGIYKSTEFDETLLLLYHSVRMRRCADHCEEKFMGRRPAVARYVRNEFEKREPYNYLQFAYFQVGSLRKAAQAALTYLETNQEHAVMQKNFQFYVSELGVKNKTIKSMEMLPHVELFMKGDDAYQARDYQSCIDLFEESLNEYYKALQKCHILCEYQHEKQQSSFSVALFDHFTAILECRKGCDAKLQNIGPKMRPKLLQDHYHYLQFSYFEVGRHRDAAICAKTYQLFDPKDPIMEENIAYYNELLGGDRVNIFPRKRALLLLKEKQVSEKLVSVAKQFADPTHVFEEEETEANIDDIEIANEVEGTSTLLSKGDKSDDGVHLDTELPPMKRSDRSRNQTRWKSNPQYEGVRLHLAEKDLNGTERVAVDHVITGEECQKLMNFVERLEVSVEDNIAGIKEMDHVTGVKLKRRLAVDGDGYSTTHAEPSKPFTEKETFKGVNVVAAAQAVLQGRASIEELELYMNLSQRALRFTEDYFDLRRPLYFAFTHLVCRTALPEATDEDPFDPDAVHLSHPVHSDNCLLGADGFGTCPKRLPAYTWRDYSAILYLNDDFEGGEFVFADHKLNIQSLLPVKCGRLVAFSAGFENLHGVLGVRKGKRCALPLWFTFSKEKAEKQRSEVERLLAKLKRNRATMQRAETRLKEHEKKQEKEDTSENKPVKASAGRMDKGERSSKKKNDLVNHQTKDKLGVNVVGERSEL